MSGIKNVRKNKGVSNVVAGMLIFIIIVTLTVSTVVTLQLENSEYSTTTYVMENYKYLHDLMEAQLKNDILNISYYAFPTKNGYCLEITFQLNPQLDYSSPYSVNVTYIIAYNSQGLEPMKNTSPQQMKYPVNIYIYLRHHTPC
ncbi:MAG: hypothetical protein RXR17_06910 [Sulfolobaceae archaeon]